VIGKKAYLNAQKGCIENIIENKSGDIYQCSSMSMARRK
jgi:hypothetical protein